MLPMRRRAPSAVLLALVATALSAAAQARTYAIGEGTSMGFGVRHIVSQVDGSFAGFSGTVTADPADLAATKADVVVKTATVDTKNEKRDTHLRTADFFDVEKHPDMTFALDQVTPGEAPGMATGTGRLTLLGVTQPVTLDITEIAFAGDALTFRAQGKLDRTTFGMTYNRARMIGDEITLDLRVKAVAAP